LSHITQFVLVIWPIVNSKALIKGINQVNLALPYTDIRNGLISFAEDASFYNNLYLDYLVHQAAGSIHWPSSAARVSSPRMRRWLTSVTG